MCANFVKQFMDFAKFLVHGIQSSRTLLLLLGLYAHNQTLLCSFSMAQTLLSFFSYIWMISYSQDLHNLWFFMLMLHWLVIFLSRTYLLRHIFSVLKFVANTQVCTSLKKYIIVLLQCFNMMKAKGVRTPLVCSTILTLYDGSSPTDCKMYPKLPLLSTAYLNSCTNRPINTGRLQKECYVI